MKNKKYLIIINQNNKLGDMRLYKVLREYDHKFITGVCSVEGTPCNTKCCIWYLMDEDSCIASLDLTDFVKGNYKFMSIDDGYFECNCADIDLPMIEDVWEEIIKDVICIK